MGPRFTIFLVFVSVCSVPVQSKCFKDQTCHSTSSLCESDDKQYCDHQLKQSQDGGAMCLLERTLSDCELDPSHISPWDNMLFDLGAYWSEPWPTRPAFNLSFPSPNWKNLKFRFDLINGDKKPFCRGYTLYNVTLPLADTLFFDCPIHEIPRNRSKTSYRLTVQSEEGEGGAYLFSLPLQSRINPNTPLHDWHVFFFYHVDYWSSSPYVPVTLKTVPSKFGRVSYNVSLVKCVDGTVNCSERAVLDSKLVTAPENDKEATVLLHTWNNVATYAFTVQIISEECYRGNSTGCFVAVSPVYVVEFSSFGIWSCIVFGVILSFALVFFITLHKRIKQNRLLLVKLREKPRKVLLVYLPETTESLDMVKTLATFLKECCYIQPFIVDLEVGCQDPKVWTNIHFKAAECVLFLVPGQLQAESITPIRGHWNYAKSYAIGKYNKYSNMAAVTFPFSAEVPDDLPYQSRFSVPHQMEKLITWIHGGTWLDSLLLWGPQVTSPPNKNKDRLNQVEKAIDEATKANPRLENYLKSQECPAFTSISIPDGKTKKNESEDNNVILNDDNKSSKMIEDSDSMDEVFDPNIPDVMTLLADWEGERSNTTSSTSSESSDEEMDENLFV